MQIVNPLTSFTWSGPLDINNIPMRGISEKQGYSFSRAGYLAALDSPHLDADAVGRAVRQQLRPLSKPILERAKQEYGDRKPPLFPHYFIIEPTAVCNRAWPFCTILVTNLKGVMKGLDFTKLMNESSEFDVYGLSLYQLGEPFLWRETVEIEDSSVFESENKPDISDMVNYAKKQAGFKIVNP